MTQDALTAYQGPWWTEQQVIEFVHADAELVAEARAQRRVVGLQFNDGLYYYPARQFAFKPQRGVLANLKDVLDVLATGIDDPETWITWMAGLEKEGSTTTMWDMLAAGRMEELIMHAKHDTWSWRN